MKAGEILQITFNNKLITKPLTIHLHGINQKNTTFYDGVGGISQQPVLAGSSFIIKTFIEPDQIGTFMYHAHYGMLTIDGLLIIDPPATSSMQFGFPP